MGVVGRPGVPALASPLFPVGLVHVGLLACSVTWLLAQWRMHLTGGAAVSTVTKHGTEVHAFVAIEVLSALLC